MCLCGFLGTEFISNVILAQRVLTIHMFVQMQPRTETVLMTSLGQAFNSVTSWASAKWLVKAVDKFQATSLVAHACHGLFIIRGHSCDGEIRRSRRHERVDQAERHSSSMLRSLDLVVGLVFALFYVDWICNYSEIQSGDRVIMILKPRNNFCI